MPFWSESKPSEKNVKRQHPGESDEDYFNTYSSISDSGSEWGVTVPKKPPKKKARKNPPSKPLQKTPTVVKIATKASILSLASNEIPGSNSASERLAEVDNAILGKIKKALALGGHQGTSEVEAKRAMRLATKLMARHNVDQADIVAAEEDSEKLKRAGQSTVTIKSTSGRGVVLHSWSRKVAASMRLFFDCKSYSTSYEERHDQTFYGLAEQTVAAAYAFEMVYNLVLVWSAQNKKAKGRSGKNNYCHGVAAGLYSLAKKDRREEEARVIAKEREQLENAPKAEKEEHDRAMERLAGPAPPKYEDEPVVDVKVKVEEVPDADVKVKVEEVPDEDVKVKVEEVPDEDVKVKVKVEEVPDEDVKVKAEAVHDGDTISKPGSATFGREGQQERSDSDSDEEFGFSMDGPDDIGVKADFDDRDEDGFDQLLQDIEHDFKPKPGSANRNDTSATQPSLEPMLTVKKEDDTPWASSQQLTKFRDNASSIADDYLKQHKVKLYASRPGGRPRLQSSHDRDVYKQGKRDARNIDVKRKRIKGMDDDE